MCCDNSLLEGIKHVPLGEESWTHAPGFLKILPRAPFSFADSALYPLL